MGTKYCRVRLTERDAEDLYAMCGSLNGRVLGTDIRRRRIMGNLLDAMTAPRRKATGRPNRPCFECGASYNWNHDPECWTGMLERHIRSGESPAPEWGGSYSTRLMCSACAAQQDGGSPERMSATRSVGDIKEVDRDE